MKLENVLFLAAATARSKAYAYALYKAGFSVDSVLLLKKPGDQKSGSGNPEAELEEVNGILLPDLSSPLIGMCERVSSQIDEVSCSSIGDDHVVSYIAEKKPKLIIFSGFGGELVPSIFFSFGIPFLHMHAGWLPEYRGSTTIYYSLLEGATCGVSALLLDEKIDNGPIVGRREYPPPPKGIDIDYIYDNAIRADLLVSVLSNWHVDQSFHSTEAQEHERSTTYYVVHPLLKHIALLGLENGKIQSIYKEKSSASIESSANEDAAVDASCS